MVMVRRLLDLPQWPLAHAISLSRFFELYLEKAKLEVQGPRHDVNVTKHMTSGNGKSWLV